MIQIAIVDDEMEIANQIFGILKKISIEEKLEIYCYSSKEDFQYDIDNKLSFDIVFMDICLKTDDGIMLAKEYIDLYPASVIIFVSGYSRYMKEAFAVRPVGFISKPIEFQEVENVFRRALYFVDKTPTFTYMYNKHEYRILVNDICCFESMQRLILIETISGEKKFYGKLQEIEDEIGEISDKFIRISQSVLVNFKYIFEISAHTVKIKIGEKEKEYSISRKYKESVSRKYLSLMKRG